MKKLLLILLIMMTAAAFVAAQTYDELEDGFESFSSDLAGSLPYASTIGLNWSDAYMGGFPHFGVGLTTGFVSLPTEGFEEIADLLGVSLPSMLSDYGIGVPLPAYTVDARIGIPVLPLDVGVKGGYISPDWLSSMDVGVDYLLLGADVRYAVLEGNMILPKVSVGVGYNYMKGGVYMDGVVDGQSIDLTGEGSPGGVNSIDITDGDLAYEWSTNVIDVKVQASKKILILTPSVGLGYSYGFSTAGGGIDSDIKVNGSSDPTQTQLDAIEAITGMEISDSSLRITAEDNSGSFRVWGGCSVNLFLLKLDLAAMYNLTSQNLGASLNARVQF